MKILVETFEQNDYAFPGSIENPMRPVFGINPQTGEEELVEKDGKSMIGILSLGIAKDKPFTLTLDGEDEDIFLSKFEELLDNE